MSDPTLPLVPALRGVLAGDDVCTVAVDTRRSRVSGDRALLVGPDGEVLAEVSGSLVGSDPAGFHTVSDLAWTAWTWNGDVRFRRLLDSGWFRVFPIGDRLVLATLDRIDIVDNSDGETVSSVLARGRPARPQVAGADAETPPYVVGTSLRSWSLAGHRTLTAVGRRSAVLDANGALHPLPTAPDDLYEATDVDGEILASIDFAGWLCRDGSWQKVAPDLGPTRELFGLPGGRFARWHDATVSVHSVEHETALASIKLPSRLATVTVPEGSSLMLLAGARTAAVVKTV